MRKVVTQLLVILLCMPYLACAMPACGHETVVSQAETQPCPAHDKLAEHKGQQTVDIMFLLDCTGVDVPLIVHDTALQKADDNSDDTALANHEIDPVKAHAFFKTNAQPIWDAASKSPLNIILMTQRFRL